MSSHTAIDRAGPVGSGRDLAYHARPEAVPAAEAEPSP